MDQLINSFRNPLKNHKSSHESIPKIFQRFVKKYPQSQGYQGQKCVEWFLKNIFQRFVQHSGLQGIVQEFSKLISTENSHQKCLEGLIPSEILPVITSENLSRMLYKILPKIPLHIFAMDSYRNSPVDSVRILTKLSTEYHLKIHL